MRPYILRQADGPSAGPSAPVTPIYMSAKFYVQGNRLSADNFYRLAIAINV
jgi:hypothetical protein